MRNWENTSKLHGLIKLNVPPFDRYFQRSDEERKIMQGIEKIAAEKDNARLGIFMVGGGAGIGKSTLVSTILRDPKNSDFFLHKCNVQIVVWKNCYEWKDGIKEDQGRQFLQSLLEIGKTETVGEEWRQWTTLRKMIDYFLMTKNKRILFVLDDVFHDSIIDTFRSDCDSAICLAITRYPEPFIQRLVKFDEAGSENPFILGQMSEQQLVEMFEMTFSLKGRLSGKDLTKLAEMCCGSPLMASLLAGHLAFSTKNNQIAFKVKQLMEDLGKVVGNKRLPNMQRQQDETAKTLFLCAFNQIEDEQVKQCLKVFLLFKPVEAVKIEHLAFLWNVHKFDAVSISEELEKMSLVRRVRGNVNSCDNFALSTHHFLLKAAAEHGVSKVYSSRLAVLLQIGEHLSEAEGIDDFKKLEHFVYKCPKPLLETILPNFKKNDFEKIQFTGWTQVDDWPSEKEVEATLEVVAKCGISSLFELLDQGDKTWRGGRSLIEAAQNGHLDVVKCIGKTHPETVHLNDNLGETALTKAVKNGHLDVVKFLCEKFPEFLESSMTKAAASGGHLDVFEFFFEKCPESVKLRDEKSGETALMTAALKGHLNIVKFIYENNPHSIKALDKYGCNSLMKAASNGHLDVVRFIDEKWPVLVMLHDKCGETALIKAACNGHLNVVRFLYEKYPASVRVQDIFGTTALAMAALRGRLDVVKFLYEKYPEATKLKNVNGKTALMTAAHQGHRDVVDFLFRI